ncbi:hypothetical protein PR202_gb05082 [Eleusine coracana subsp. coracana]|uniref:Uncharacterized protein n=1 Tax=Eleusine coracana subsp. coracana TaxID=191504 RepID=A0AAV5E700_ELECO|nr:hypothetical protein PR202_gb05082 [Eleusine coracana subsp. coracana]
MTSSFPSKLLVLLFFLVMPALLEAARPLGHDREPDVRSVDIIEDANASSPARLLFPAPPGGDALHRPPAPQAHHRHHPLYNRQPGSSGERSAPGSLGGSRRARAPPAPTPGRKPPHGLEESTSSDEQPPVQKPVDVLLVRVLGETAGRVIARAVVEIGKIVQGLVRTERKPIITYAHSLMRVHPS